MRAEGQTDGQTHRQKGTIKLIFAFRNFANRPKKLETWNSNCAATMDTNHRTDKQVFPDRP